jgi:tetratricopeptide (TPR) repeat protein
MAWVVTNVFAALVDGWWDAIEGLEGLIARLVNPKAHAWIAANGEAVGLHERGLRAEAGAAYVKALDLARASRRMQRVAITLVNLALLEMHEGRFAEAQGHLAEALGIRSRELGADSPTTARTRRYLAAVYFELRQPEKAAELHAFTLQGAARRFGEESTEVAVASLDLASALEKAGDMAEAERHYRSTAALAERVAGPRARPTAHYLFHLGRFLVARERMEEARPVLTRAVEIWDMVGDEAALTPALEELLTVHRATGEQAAATRTAEHLVRNVTRFRSGDREAVADAMSRREEILRWAGDVAEADKVARRAGILRAALEKERLEDSHLEERRREATRAIVGPVDEVLADARPEGARARRG